MNNPFTSARRRVAEEEERRRQLAAYERLQYQLMSQMASSASIDPGVGASQTVIHERNDEGKPSSTHVSGKPGSVLPREILVHLQEVKGEEREKEVLKAVEAIGKKPQLPRLDSSRILYWGQLQQFNPQLGAMPPRMIGSL